jgi:hypothetical protein
MEANDAPGPLEPTIPLDTLEQGEVDLSLIEYLLSLTPAQRAERHYAARLLAQRMQQIARQRYGTALDAIEAPE